jgi:hypothetical protein
MVVMLKDRVRCAGEAPDAVGIVVKSGRSAAAPARTASFVWGLGVAAAPSLPFGRWKTAHAAS